MGKGQKHIYSWEELEDGEWVHHERECECEHDDDHHETDEQGYSWDEAGNMYQNGEIM